MVRLRSGSTSQFLLQRLCLLALVLLCGQSAVFAGFFTTSSIWNQPIGNDPIVDSNSSLLIQKSLSSGANGGKMHISLNDYSVPVYYVGSNTSTYNVPVSYPWYPYRVPGPGFGTNVPIPAEARPASGSDGHMVVVDRDKRLAWDFYQAVKTATGWKATYGIRWDLNGPGVNKVWTASARAAGAPLLGGLILHDEVKAGKISHALAFSAPVIRAKVIVNPPASATQAGSTDLNTLAMGNRIQLNPALNLDSYNLTPAAKTVAKALQEYGAFLVDCSKTNVIYAEDMQYNSTQNWSGILTATSLWAIPLDKFRVVKVSGAMAREGDAPPETPDDGDTGEEPPTEDGETTVSAVSAGAQSATTQVLKSMNPEGMRVIPVEP